jgi:hypothetical protein
MLWTTFFYNPFSEAEETLRPQHSLEGKCWKGNMGGDWWGPINKNQHRRDDSIHKSFLGGAMHPFGERRAVVRRHPTMSLYLPTPPIMSWFCFELRVSRLSALRFPPPCRIYYGQFRSTEMKDRMNEWWILWVLNMYVLGLYGMISCKCFRFASHDYIVLA